MSLADVLRNGVAVAHRVTTSLQPSVTHKAWIGQDGYGNETYAASVPLSAIVDRTQQQRVLPDGRVVLTFAKLTFLDVIAPNGAAGRTEPIDTRDELVLADGSTAPIVDVSGPVDPATGRPYVLEVLLGFVTNR